jgi:hypothetical protein
MIKAFKFRAQAIFSLLEKTQISCASHGQSLFTDGELAYHRYRRYRRTVFWRATLCHRNNANYLIHQRNLQIYRWRIHLSIGTDGQSLFTDGELAYHH